MNRTVIEHVLSRLYDIGIRDVFGVPGDYAFPVNDAICNSTQPRWIGCCNELNAAYAADGYARVKGFGALCTTYGVGELSALNGIAGAYAEHLPIFHLVGTPNMATQAGRAAMHHTLGNGEYELFQRMTEPVVCATAVMTPQNVAYETERLIAAALYHRRPVYSAPTISMGLGFARMPRTATFHNQTLWGSIGWATPAAFGAAVAAPDRRVVLFTGEGSHQFTAQEISQFGRLGLKPVVFVLNNSGYLIERLLCKDPSIA